MKALTITLKTKLVNRPHILGTQISSSEGFILSRMALKFGEAT